MFTNLLQEMFLTFFCIILTDSGIEGATSPPLGKDHIPSSPMTDRKKKKRNRSINLKGDAAAGQAEGKRSDTTMIQFH